MRIGLDAMGGDLGPANAVEGGLQAREQLSSDDIVVLVGDRAVIEAELDGKNTDQIEIAHASQVVGMEESPVEALRTKPDSSLAVLGQLHKAGEIDAMISAGNTGATVASAQMYLRRLDGVHRPGITIVAPTFHGPVALCDVGANVNCRPEHLYQYGVMASLYVSACSQIDNPRVGLLSVGEEQGKGNDLVKKTNEMLAGDPNINFVGNVEGRDLIGGVCDVMVCEGFVGNVVLKLFESMGSQLVRGVIGQMVEDMPDQIERIMGTAEKIKAQYDYNIYGGAPLLGAAGICMICHGKTTSMGLGNAVAGAKRYASQGVNQRIVEQLGGK